ncbi:MAG: S8 family serine peptidase [bacterium]|nr:S8 family serine peptidase [bacterium]
MARLAAAHPHWRQTDGACPACVQEALLYTLLAQGDAALHYHVQRVWPLDAAAAFGAIPTPLRLHADPRFAGRGVTIAILDSGFYPHPDLTQPRNRIRAWVDASCEPMHVVSFQPDEQPHWPGWEAGTPSQWHGTMTAVTAAGNGRLSHGLYRGLASEAELVLIQVSDGQGIHNPAIARALRWLVDHHAEWGVRVVSMSFGGDAVADLRGNPVDTAVAHLVAQNVVITVAAGNDGARRLVPPATAPEALTIGGLDDQNAFAHDAVALWRSNYGLGADAAAKPELVAPSIWVAAPVLPGTAVAREAHTLFQQRGRPASERRIADLKLITPHYQHVDGTSFAAPLVASAVACMLEANPSLTPPMVRQLLQQTATPIPRAPRERQGAGALEAGLAVAAALREQHQKLAPFTVWPRVADGRITFLWHDHTAQKVQVMGSWDSWQTPGLTLAQVESGVWQGERPLLPPGRYAYKFLLDSRRWFDDPANPRKVWDGYGGLNSLLLIPA